MARNKIRAGNTSSFVPDSKWIARLWERLAMQSLSTREITEILKYVLWALSGDVTTIIETTKIAPQTARQQYLLQAGGIGA